MLFMIAVASPLIVAAIACWIIASRIDLKRKIKSWSGERTTVEEAQSARTKILVLRILTGVCAVSAVLVVIALSLMQAYAAR